MGMRYSFDSMKFPQQWCVNETGTLGTIETGLLGLRTINESLIVSSGMMVYIPAGIPYYETPLSETLQGWCISLPEDRTKFLGNDGIRILSETKLMSGFCEEIVSWGKIKTEDKSPRQRRLVLAFLDELEKSKDASYLTVPLPLHSGLCIVTRRITQFPEDKEGIDYWAKVAGMSRRSFTGRFMNETGLSFSVWRQRVKIHAAVKMLSSGKTITEVAANLNFPTTSAFSESFKKHLGLPPRDYMKRENYVAPTDILTAPPQSNRVTCLLKGMKKIRKLCCP